MAFRVLPGALCVAIALLLAACGGDGDSTSSGGTPGTGGSCGSGGQGSLLYTLPTGLVECDLESGEVAPLITPTEANTFILDPAVSPDATRIAYVRQPPPQVEEGRYDAGADLWVANRDGSDPRMIFRHVEPNQLVRFPQWQDDANVLAVIQEIGMTDGLTTVVYTLQRVNVETGERTRILDDTLSFTVTPSGDRVAYARLSRQTGETLAAVNLDGTDEVTLVDVTENLSPFNFPRYSPDGAQIAFASADQTLAPPIPTFAPQPTPPTGRLARAGVAALLPDGLPQDIWTVDAGGGRPRMVADLKEDLPALTWNGDGTRIYVIGVAGLYEVNLENGQTTRIGEGLFHSQIAWAP